MSHYRSCYSADNCSECLGLREILKNHEGSPSCFWCGAGPNKCTPLNRFDTVAEKEACYVGRGQLVMPGDSNLCDVIQENYIWNDAKEYYVRVMGRWCAAIAFLAILFLSIILLFYARMSLLKTKKSKMERIERKAAEANRHAKATKSAKLTYKGTESASRSDIDVEQGVQTPGETPVETPVETPAAPTVEFVATAVPESPPETPAFMPRPADTKEEEIRELKDRLQWMEQAMRAHELNTATYNKADLPTYEKKQTTHDNPLTYQV